MTETFWVEPTGDVVLSLRRYSRDEVRPCRPGKGYHDAAVPAGRAPAVTDADGYVFVNAPAPPASDPRWPMSCDYCDYRFESGDGRRMRQVRVYRCPDTGEEWAQDELPPGAMFDADWLPSAWKGQTASP